MNTIGVDGPSIAAILEALPDPVMLVSAELRILCANQAARAILPRSRADEPLELVLRSPDVLDGVRTAVASRRAETVTWRERVPVDRFFEVHIAPLLTGAPTIGAVVITLRDMSEAHNIERMRADFVANASHEMRTPLATLLGFVETLQGPARDDAVARGRFLAIMAEQARRMARLLDDLLSLSRIEQSLHVRPSSPVDLSLVIRHIADTLGPLAAENGLRLTITAQPNVVVAGDRDEILRVAENLIENAIKYGRPAGRTTDLASVDISIAANARDGILVVRDFGAGIPPEHIPRLTERFYRVDAGQSRAKGGTGLGLAIVKHIVARHRGRLAFDSTVGQGSTFVVSLPLYEKCKS